MTEGSAAVEDLWSAFKQTGATGLRNELVLQYSPLVKFVAGRVRSSLPPNVDPADLVSEGLIGLMDAIEKFDPGRGLQFQTYAVPRIRGAIIDSIRAADWVPRSVRARIRDIEAAREALRHRLSRTPTDEEIAGEVGTTVAELREIRERASMVSTAGDDGLVDVDGAVPDLAEGLEDEDTRRLLKQVVRTMPERDQVVLALYFFEGLTLAEIGQVLEVTESRVSQLRSRATGLLRERLVAALADD